MIAAAARTPTRGTPRVWTQRRTWCDASCAPRDGSWTRKSECCYHLSEIDFFLLVDVPGPGFRFVDYKRRKFTSSRVSWTTTLRVFISSALTAWAVRSVVQGRDQKVSRADVSILIIRRDDILFGKVSLCMTAVASHPVTHLRLVFQPQVPVLQKPVEVIEPNRFRFPFVRVVHQVLHAAHRGDGGDDDGERGEGFDGLQEGVFFWFFGSG